MCPLTPALFPEEKCLQLSWVWGGERERENRFGILGFIGDKLI
ncbi:MAG: hypothetical protein JWR15_962 [Prosthecobacter sp.]|nr:hypothetical protein [Prosthecobacter sp.]